MLFRSEPMHRGAIEAFDDAREPPFDRAREPRSKECIDRDLRLLEGLPKPTANLVRNRLPRVAESLGVPGKPPAGG